MLEFWQGFKETPSQLCSAELSFASQYCISRLLHVPQFSRVPSIPDRSFPSLPSLSHHADLYAASRVASVFRSYESLAWLLVPYRKPGRPHPTLAAGGTCDKHEKIAIVTIMVRPYFIPTEHKENVFKRSGIALSFPSYQAENQPTGFAGSKMLFPQNGAGCWCWVPAFAARASSDVISFQLNTK